MSQTATAPAPVAVPTTEFKSKDEHMCKHFKKHGVDAEYVKKCTKSTSVCTKCGRTAENPANLCRPQKF